MLQKEGGKLFNELVEEGKRVETRSKATPAKGRGKGGSLAETVVAKKETYSLANSAPYIVNGLIV
jgi:hypothetical protein